MRKHPSWWRPWRRLVRGVRRPQWVSPPPPTAAPRAGSAKGKLIDPPLDGYAYVALKAMPKLRSYSSVFDQALFVSPWANRTTEEVGTSSGLLRMGSYGPLHPALTLAKPGARHLALVECSEIVFEHGDYFYDPRVQRDMTACVYALQSSRLASGTALGPAFVGVPPELVEQPAWHLGRPLQFPAGKGTARVEDKRFCQQHREELEFYKLGNEVAKHGESPTEPRTGAPARQRSLLIKAWKTAAPTPVGIVRWWYRV